jgi:hypothetical protein
MQYLDTFPVEQIVQFQTTHTLSLISSIRVCLAKNSAQRNAALLPLDATANATHPPINATPPSGVMGPMTLKRCGSRTSM